MKKAPTKKAAMPKMAKGGKVKCADGGEGGEKGYSKGGKVSRGTGCATKGKAFKGSF